MYRKWEHRKNFEESLGESFKHTEPVIHGILNSEEAGSEFVKKGEKNLTGHWQTGKESSNTHTCRNMESTNVPSELGDLDKEIFKQSI